MGAAATRWVSLTNSDDYTFRIQFLVVLAVVATFILHVLGSLRRRLRAALLHNIVMLILTLSYTLVSYTIGLMQASSLYRPEFTLWAVCLLLLLGGTDNLTACRLSDLDNWKGFFLRYLLQAMWVVWIVAQFGTGTGTSSYQAPLLWSILFIVLLKSHARIKSMRVASKSYQLLSKDVKAIADYMHHEHHEGARPPYDPATMRGYRYVVAAAGHRYEIRIPEYRLRYKYDVTITTVEDIWGCTGSLLRHESRKDVCLSMALLKMLKRRFAGLELAEAGLPKTQDLVFRGLLAGNKPYERAFRVIEEELALLHDLYYTTYPYLYQKGRFLAPVVMLGLCSSWVIVLLVHERSDGTRISIFVLATVVFLEAFQLYLYVASGWFKAALITSYVNSPLFRSSGFFLHMIMGCLLRLKAVGAWEKKLGQYSFLSSMDNRSRANKCLHLLTMRLVDSAKEGRKEEKRVKLSVEVKQAIVDSLLQSNGDLTIGVRSLKDHGHLSWACDGSATHTILVWHIATTLCKYQLDEQIIQLSTKQKHPATEDEMAVKNASAVASSLSRYCAYLLAFAPELLPDHTSRSSLILDVSIREARHLLRGAYSMKTRCMKLREIAATPGATWPSSMSQSSKPSREFGIRPNSMDVTLVELGARLARHLMEDIKEPTLRWKVLSDFWAEMMLYVAPSDNALAHLEPLAKGGEFITHLWALLMHAGMLKQGLRESTGMSSQV